LRELENGPGAGKPARKIISPALVDRLGVIEIAIQKLGYVAGVDTELFHLFALVEIALHRRHCQGRPWKQR
jgi:hypothetical protein